MRLNLLLAATALVVLLLPATAGAAPTPGFTFKHGETNGRTGPTFSGGGSRECAGPACTYETHEFEIKPGEENGRLQVQITWAGLGEDFDESDAQDDWDLFVYQVVTDPEGNEVEVQVASSAQGGTREETASMLSPLTAPIPAGKYRIYVDNWKVTPQNQEWLGFVAFEPYAPVNQRPVATLSAPDQARGGQPVTLDASGSTDADGTVVDYAWDLNGDGRFETEGGTSPRRETTFASGGRKSVGVRVKDDKGAVAYAARTIRVASGAGRDRFVEVPPPAGSITLDFKPRQTLAQVALRGVAGTVTCPTECEILGSLRISGATSRRLGLGRSGRTIATSRRALGGVGSTPRVRLKPRSRTLRAMRRSRGSIVAFARITVSAEGYAPRTFVRRVTITR